MITFFIVFTIFVTTVTSECGYPKPPVVCIENGCIRGKPALDLKRNQYESFQGIAFAKPPVGDLRFSDPVPNDPWCGQYDATWAAVRCKSDWERSACVQEYPYSPSSTITGSEDCLYLNVYRPMICKQNYQLPVMVFIHGGGYQGGSSSSLFYGPERFMSNKSVILVTIQYRLGVFGFLATGDSAAPGNFGMKDQVLALKWVKKNIDRFGGDPNCITIFGQSAGGASVQLHMLSPMSEGLFSKAIVMSGSALAIWSLPLPNPSSVVRAHAKLLGIACSDTIATKDLVEELRKVDPVSLIKTMDGLKVWNREPEILYRPSIDGEFLTDNPVTLWGEAKYHKIPWMTGFLPNEAATDVLQWLVNDTILNELITQGSTLIPLMLGVESSPELINSVKDNYFPSDSADQWITCSNSMNVSDLLGDAEIKYPLIKSIKQYLTHPDNPPVSVYFFNFRGPYSYSYLYSNSLIDADICHADDLIYLFRSPAYYIPDFQVIEPAYCVAKKWVDYFVNFAYNGHTDVKCTAEKCSIQQITNSIDPNCTVNLDVLDGFDERMFQLWDNYYVDKQVIPLFPK